MGIRFLSIAAAIGAAIVVVLAQSASASVPLPVNPVQPPGQTGPAQVKLKPKVFTSVKNDTSPPLRELAKNAPPIVHQAGPEIEIPSIVFPPDPAGKQGPPRSVKDPVAQGFIGEGEFPATNQNFDGLANVQNPGALNPPDTNGDVGPNHYVQWVNIILGMWDKSGNQVLGPVQGNVLFSGFGGLCDTTNRGDPIVLYDRIADRWMLSQFAFNVSLGDPVAPYYECIAVSKTGDPTGEYHRYAFLMPNNVFNDYPKFGVWPDAYYYTVHQFDGAPNQGVGAFEREKMLVGEPASFVYFDLLEGEPNVRGMLPATLNGPLLPPAGSPGYFMNYFRLPNPILQLWKFKVDFQTPSNSTFTLAHTLPVAAFTDRFCADRNCIPQPGTIQKLDSLGDRLMYRLNYRNFGGYDSLVLNHTVTGTTSLAGIRWYEVRNPGGTPTVHQQSTYAPDSDNRWMASINQDRDGNIALGFSVSSSVVTPSIRATGRLATDPLNTLPQGETTVYTGTGVQTSVNHRWGDYTSMSIDPVDDCTFWYTNEYYTATTTVLWRTRIASFKFPSCSAQPAAGTITGLVTSAQTGAPVPGAHVQASLNPTMTYGTNADAQGVYTLPVPAGSYTVTGSAKNYVSASYSAVNVAANITTTRPITLPASPLLKRVAYRATEIEGNGNGIPDPGEKIAIDIDLNNTGITTATAVSSLLSVSGGGASILSGTSLYPTIGISLTATNSLSYTVQLPTAPCGEEFGFIQQVTAAGGYATNNGFTLRVGAPVTGVVPASYPYVGPPLPILDYPALGTTAPFTLSAPNQYVADLDVSFTISHTYASDLALELISPNGKHVTLARILPDSGPTVGMLGTTLDDAASPSILTATPSYTGTYRPVSPLSVVNGDPISGVWRLVASDEFGADSGQIMTATLKILPVTYTCTPYTPPSPTPTTTSTPTVTPSPTATPSPTNTPLPGATATPTVTPGGKVVFVAAANASRQSNLAAVLPRSSGARSVTAW